MSRSWSGPAATIPEVERAIGTYLDEKPYSSRFKARNLVNETPLDATANEIASILSEMESDGTLTKISYSAGASTYRPTDESQFTEADQ